MRYPFVHELFSRNAEAFPEHIAIVQGERQITYRELNRFSDTVARQLAKVASAKGKTVALLVDDRIFMIASILGTLKAGGAFVPVPSEMPDARVRLMFDQCGPSIVLTQPHLRERATLLSASPSRTTQIVSLVSPAASDSDAESLPLLDRDPDDFCYVYFTSGSSGKPKGIAGRLRAIDHFIRWEIKTLNLQPGTRVSQLINPSFDAFLRDMFVPLCSLGTICVPSRDVLRDAEALGNWMQKERVNLVHCVPTVLRALLASVPEGSHFPYVKHILLSGEPLYGSDIKKVHERLGSGVQIVNLYGPSETTMTKFAYCVRPGDENLPSIPIGKPIQGCTALVLDEQQHICPVGTVGEIYIRTPFRALGYYRQPELTSHMFVQNPFTNDPRDLLYKTGDVGRILENGNFEYLGRNDQQVKIHGVRIELSEIEHVLRTSNLVEDCAVVDSEDVHGEKHLCAYLVMRNNSTPSEVRAHLVAQLPEYMVPSAYVELDELPHTPSGKLDRKKLPAPDAGRTRKRYKAPRTPTEEILCGIWGQLLKAYPISIDNKFFEIGGHSLLATQVISRIRKLFAIELPLRVFLRNTTIAELALQIEMLKAEERETEQAPPLLPITDQHVVPLSYVQQRLWMLEQLEPGSAVYNMPFALRMRGKLDENALRFALSAIVDRHAGLRTVISMEGGEPVQRILAIEELPLDVVDLRNIQDDQDRELKARWLARQEAARVFDLSSGPLFHLKLVRLSDHDHVLLVIMHHLVSDGWSVGILIREFAELYSAHCENRQARLEELPIQYADYSVWQRKWMESGELERQLAYWTQHLDGAATLEFPADRPRPVVPSHRGEATHVYFGQELTKKITELSQREGVTLFMTLLAGFQLVLSKYAGQNDVVVGTPIANRNRAEIEGLIGSFANTLVLRTQMDQERSFRDLLAQVREIAFEAFARQDTPFEKLVEALQPQRDLGRTPLFQSMLVLQNMPEDDLVLPGLKFESWGALNTKAKFDLLLTLQQNRQGELQGTVTYATDLFSEQTMLRFTRHFRQLLENAVGNVEQKLCNIELASPSEQLQLVNDWNTSVLWSSKVKYAHELFEEHAERNPCAIAVVFQDYQLTYVELNRRANQVAHYLRNLGVGPEVPVAVCMERGSDLVVCLLGILKAGGAYLPLDPTYPPERLEFIVRDANPRVLITDTQSKQRTPSFAGPVLQMDADWERIAGESDRNPARQIAPPNLAYVIYTSGSTGNPKGSLNTHQNLSWLLATSVERFDFGPGDVWTLFHSYAFDFSVWEMWGALAYGGRLVIVPYYVSRSPEELHRLLVRERVTVLNQTPSAFHQFVQFESGQSTKLPTLRYVIFGGEMLDVETLRSWFESRNRTPVSLVNMYGITETTVHVTFRKIQSDDLEHQGNPIGGPLPAVQCYVLDQYMQPVPIGVAGELYVGGQGLSRGYLNRPELSAARFVPNPFSQEAGERLYRAGDRARWSENGELEYLGRIDHQVKIRGFRIELGEIEAALLSHQDIGEAVVIARENGEGSKMLVAYVVLRNKATTSSPIPLREYLHGKLPPYMVPARFVYMDALPLTSNGKRDRKRLPEPETHIAQDKYVAPRTPEEQTLAEIWAEVLNLDQVGINDDFFALGGDSIHSIRVKAKAEQRGLKFSLQQMFQFKTIAELSQVFISKGASARAETVPFALLTAEERLQVAPEIEDAYPLTSLQTGMVFQSEFNLDANVYHDVFSHHLKLAFNADAMREALRWVVVRHPMLRTSFDMSGFSRPLQLVRREIELPLAIEDVSWIPPAQQEEIITAWLEQEKRNHFRWTQSSLFRITIHLRKEDELQCTLTCHHAVLDGWSVATLLTELIQKYNSLMGGKEFAPEPITESSFRDFVELEQAALRSEEHKAYWINKLGDNIPSVLPRWFQSADRPGFYDYLTVRISDEISAGLQQTARVLGVSLKSVLLAAHVRVLALLTGRWDVQTGTTTHGRPETADGERIIGLFLNMLPFRLRLQPGSWADLVRQVFANEQEIVPYRRYPMAEIQRLVGGGQVFEVAFNFIHFHIYKHVRSEEIKILKSVTFTETDQMFGAHFSLSSAASQVELQLRYHSAEFPRKQVEGIAEYYLRALEALAKEPFAAHSNQALLSSSEMSQIVEQWSTRTVGSPRDVCVADLFEQQAEERPEAIAVVFGGKKWSYREMNRRANQLAHYLKKLGVGPEVRVGLCVERSVEMVLGILGVLKAGGAYVPLEASYPGERIGYMLEEVQAPVVLTQEKVKGKLPAGWRQVISLDGDWGEMEKEGEENPEREMVGTNLAYVIYTSGSTGQPKGVGVEQRQIVNYVHGVGERMGMKQGGGEKLALVSTVAADLGNTMLYPSLCWGGELHVVGEEEGRDGELLGRYFEEEGVEYVKITPSQLKGLQQSSGRGSSGGRDGEGGSRNGRGKVLPRKLVVVGGEASSWEWVKELEEEGDGCEVMNHYGPTECTVGAVGRKLGRGEWRGKKGNVPLGEPLGNIQVYVVDEEMEPVPVGVGGELYIGGEGVARGYVNRPELTAERFVPNPFVRGKSEPAAGQRLYRTGDQVRWLGDGNLEFMGRLDQQVKIRGFRIELGEIEAALQQCGGVRQAVVVAGEEEGGDKRLVAYVVGKEAGAAGGEELRRGELREQLQRRLPEYMVPSVYVELEELPLTPNGKLDRKRLPEPEHTPSALLIEPRDAIEMRLKTVWAEILGINEIGITDNFFDLGGHSLTAVSVSAYISRIYGARFSVRTIFERPTIWQLAEFLRQTKSLLQADSVVPIQPAGKKTPFFCVHPAGGMAHCYLPLAKHLGPDQPFYGFQAHGLERAQSLAISIEEMAATYIKNMKDVQPNGPYQLGGWSLGAIIAYEMAQQLTASGDKVQSLILLDGRPNFTPLSAPWTEEELRDYEQRHVDLVLARLGLSEAEIDAMTYEQQLERCISQPKADASSVPLTVTSAQFRSFLRVQATNEALVKRYHIQPYPGNLVLFKSSTPGPPEEGFGWERLAAGGVVIHSFQEEHARFVAEPNAQVVAEKLAACINDGPTLKQMPVQTLQTTLLQRSEVPYDG